MTGKKSLRAVKAKEGQHDDREMAGGMERRGERDVPEESHESYSLNQHPDNRILEKHQSPGPHANVLALIQHAP